MIDILSRQLAIRAAAAALAAIANEIRSEVPAGAINGANATFTLANVPAAGSLILFRNGLRCGPAEFNLSSATIAFGTPPAVGETILADYRH